MSTWKDVPSAGDVPGYRLFMGEVEKPALDERQYRLVELPNGLRAVFVHDATADKAAACLALATGSMMDPVRAIVALPTIVGAYGPLLTGDGKQLG